MKSRIEIRELGELVDAIREIPKGIVSFDGCPGAGKTTLAAKVAKVVGYSMVDLDSYIDKERGHFVNALHRSTLESKLRAELSVSTVVVISGVCMNAVLECVRRKAALSIYVQKNSPIGLPSDLDFIDAETGFEPEPDTVQYWSALDREVFSYHGEHKPRMNADIIFLRAAR